MKLLKWIKTDRHGLKLILNRLLIPNQLRVIALKIRGRPLPITYWETNQLEPKKKIGSALSHMSPQ